MEHQAAGAGEIYKFAPLFIIRFNNFQICLSWS